MGIGVNAVALLVAWFFLHSRSDRARRSGIWAEQPELPGMTAREGYRSPVLYKLFFATAASYVLVVGLSVHVIAILSTSGLTAEQAAVAAGGYGIFAVLGKFVCGALVNRFRSNLLAGALLALPILTCLMIMVPSDSVLMRGIAMGILGASAGGQLTMLAFMTTRHFGLRAFGAIFGVIAISVTVGTGAGPLIASYLYDVTKGYQALMILGIVLSVIGTLLMLSIREPATDMEMSGSTQAA
jgi:predicted MFS family arabinose efflux permease